MGLINPFVLGFVIISIATRWPAHHRRHFRLNGMEVGKITDIAFAGAQVKVGHEPARPRHEEDTAP